LTWCSSTRRASPTSSRCVTDTCYNGVT
jgi:hypothetical protein